MGAFSKCGFRTQRAITEISTTKWKFVHKAQGALQTPKIMRGPSAAPTKPRFFRRALANHPRATRTAWLRTASPDLADLADLRLPAEANYLQALLHSPWPLRMTQVSASGLNCSRERSPNEEVAAACIFALIRYSKIFREASSALMALSMSLKS
jgi:hypothetical protein